MVGIRVRSLVKEYPIDGQTVRVLDSINIVFPAGSFTVIVGKSGCGKTTLLRLLAGLERETEGKTEFISTVSKDNQTGWRVGVVFQEPRLMPWLTVKENIAFSQKNKTQADDKELQRIVLMLGLEKFKNAYPAQISGGMAQRVALGRALFFKADVILMDEPFSALDYFTRRALQRELVELFVGEQKTIIFVTHDVEEAVYLGQRIIILHSGKVGEELTIDLPYPRLNSDLQLVVHKERILSLLQG